MAFSSQASIGWHLWGSLRKSLSDGTQEPRGAAWEAGRRTASVGTGEGEQGGRAGGREREGEGEQCAITGAGRLKVQGSDDFTGTAEERNTGR